MKILVLAKRSGNVTVDEIRPYFKPEVEAVWSLYTQGVIREFYTRADQGGPAILSLECESVEAAQKALQSLPMVQMNLIDLDYIPLAPFNSLSHLFETESEGAKV